MGRMGKKCTRSARAKADRAATQFSAVLFKWSWSYIQSGAIGLLNATSNMWHTPLQIWHSPKLCAQSTAATSGDAAIPAPNSAFDKQTNNSMAGGRCSSSRLTKDARGASTPTAGVFSASLRLCRPSGSRHQRESCVVRHFHS